MSRILCKSKKVSPPDKIDPLRQKRVEQRRTQVAVEELLMKNFEESNVNVAEEHSTVASGAVITCVGHPMYDELLLKYNELKTILSLKEELLMAEDQKIKK